MLYIRTFLKNNRCKIRAVALFCLFRLPESLSAQTAMVNVSNRNKTSLNGQWQVILDPTGAGDWKQVWQEKKPQAKTDFVEYSYDGGPYLKVPGDFNSQLCELTWFEGSVWYKKQFQNTLQPGKRLFLHFGAVNYLTVVYLNGEKIGSYEGGFTPFQFEITNKIKSGENTIVVKANNYRIGNGLPGFGYDWFNYGGITRREFFPSAASCEDFINDVEGTESCNTYNMLKLTEDLFRVNPLAKYADYYERAVYNHILSTQHPEHGGYVYFTPVRPRHYRVYSAPNQAMWCCVGSGMENHGKYNQFIYTHKGDSLFVNLFIASELNWKSKNLKLKQETNFPFEEKSNITFTGKKSEFSLFIRYPAWVEAGKMKIRINGKEVAITEKPSSYIAINRIWKTSDKVEIFLPMHNTVERLPNVPNYVALLHGPIVLGAKTGTENIPGLIANDSRWGHIAGGERLPVDRAPIMVEDNLQNIAAKLVPVAGKQLTFTAPELKMTNTAPIEFVPFFQIHDSRYSIYWLALSNQKYKSYVDSLANLEVEKLDIQKRTVDFVTPGEQQPEADHLIQKDNSNTGNNQNQFWRNALESGFFSYLMNINAEENLKLIVRYWGAEWGNRKFDIYIDGDKLISEDNTGRWNISNFKEMEYTIPNSMTKGKKNIRVKFQAIPGNTTGAVYLIRLMRAKIL
ncbi:MAG: glycoside hydrolase family 127 protein [Paludibacter sp.]|nr:glycoside hydrolase family 127 protein [Paludibacter sp.]